MSTHGMVVRKMIYSANMILIGFIVKSSGFCKEKKIVYYLGPAEKKIREAANCGLPEL